MFLDINIFRVLILLLLSSFKFAFAIPISLYQYKFNCVETIIISSVGGILGVLFFAFLSNLLIKAWRKFYLGSKTDMAVRNFFNKLFNIKPKNKKKKVFTRRNKMIAKTKRNYGLIGLALITPSLISIPLGTFIILRSFPNQKKSILILCLSVIFWAIVFSCFFSFFVKK